MQDPLHTSKPSGFSPIFEVASCFVQADDQLLLLRRLPEKPEGGYWGVPTGKLDEGEEPREGILRELAEETGITLQDADLQHINTFYVRYPTYDFIYHLFFSRLDKIPPVRIKPDEHERYCWMRPYSAIQELSLIPGLQECIERVYPKQ